MNVSFFVARKYFWSGKKKKFINVISIISMFLVIVGTAALIIVLSVFNGLEDLLRSLHNNFDPAIEILPEKVKSFEVTEELKSTINGIEGVEAITEVIEDNAYLKYRNSEMVVTIKGVGENFVDYSNLSNSVVEGRMMLQDEKRNYAIIGRGVQIILSLDIRNEFYPLQVFYPGKLRPGRIDPTRDLRQRNILISSVFAIEKQYDEQYVFVPLDFARDLLNYGDRRTSIQVHISESADILEVQDRIQELLPDSFRVLNRDEMHASILRAVKIEKLFVFITFSVILLVASVNIFFALTMLAIDKKKDLAVLKSMGASNAFIRRIFIYEGMIISLSGTIIGILLGGLICWAQQEFGFVGMGIDNAVITSYPVKIMASDFVFTAFSMLIITFLISYRPAFMASKTSTLSL